MNKSVWTLIIIVVVLVVLYLVYKYMFATNPRVNTALSSVTPNFSVPVVKPIPTGVLSDVAISDNATRLNKMINCLGYQVQQVKSDGVANSYTTNKTLDAFVKQFPKLGNIQNVHFIPVISNGIAYKLNKSKYLEFNSLGFHDISYNNKNESEIVSLIDKMNLFWGSNYFNDCLGFANPVNTNTERAIVEAIQNSKPVVDCNDSDYLDKLRRLKITFEQAGAAYQIAVFNINGVDNAENTQALNRTSKNLTNADDAYKAHLALCKTN